MSKLVNFIDTALPWLVVITFIIDAILYWNYDNTRVLIDIAAIGGWMSLIDSREKYHALKLKIEGKSSNES